jgi:hypothetical protein
LASKHKPYCKYCRIFDDKVAEVLDCGDEIGKWLDTFLEKSDFRMVYHYLEKTQRAMTSLQKKFPSFRPKDKVFLLLLLIQICIHKLILLLI